MKYFESIITQPPHAWQFIVCLGITVLLSLIFAFAYNFLKRKHEMFKDIPLVLAIFPVIVCGVCLLITVLMNAFVGTIEEARFGRYAVALLAVVIMIRFRSQQRTLEDLTYIFFMVAVAFTIGFGYIWIGLTLYAIVFALIIILYLIKFPFVSKTNFILKITIPEDINYYDAFDDLFAEYTSNHELTKVKSIDMGTLFQLEYVITLKNAEKEKEFIDKLRVRNGNLNIVMMSKKFNYVITEK